jgi:hypothetical protein
MFRVMSLDDSHNPAIAALVAREASNNGKIAELQARIDELVKDNQRIADALSLLREVGGIGPYAEQAPTTVPEMIVRVIRDEGPMSANLIIGSIKGQWKPDVDPNNVRPVLWRLVNERRLRKRGELYELP